MTIHAGGWILGSQKPLQFFDYLAVALYFATRLPRYDRQLVAILMSALRNCVCRKRVDNGLFVISIADVRGNVCLLELPSAEVGQNRA